MVDTSPQAFPMAVPVAFQYTEAGMSLMDYFAGQALSGMLADPDVSFRSHADAAKICYNYAQAMVEHRSNPPVPAYSSTSSTWMVRKPVLPES